MSADPEQRRERDRRYREANREKIRERNRRYERANREKIRDRHRRWREANPEKVRESNHRGPKRDRNYHLRSSHGLYPEDWEALRAAQDGLCYLCGDPLPDDPAKVATDHDHRCSCGPKSSCRACRRGLAHPECNTIIGMAGDDPARLRRIAANLAQAQRRIGRLPRPLTLFDLEDT
jgi:hypothetical protein